MTIMTPELQVALDASRARATEFIRERFPNATRVLFYIEDDYISAPEVYAEAVELTPTVASDIDEYDDWHNLYHGSGEAAADWRAWIRILDPGFGRWDIDLDSGRVIRDRGPRPVNREPYVAFGVYGDSVEVGTPVYKLREMFGGIPDHAHPYLVNVQEEWDRAAEAATEGLEASADIAARGPCDENHRMRMNEKVEFFRRVREKGAQS